MLKRIYESLPPAWELKTTNRQNKGALKPFPTVYDCNRGEDPKQGINLIFLNLRKNRRISAGDRFSGVIYVLIGTKVSIFG